MKKKFLSLSLIPGLLLAVDPNPNSVEPVEPSNGFDFCVDAAFTYWYAKEDGLNLARSGVITGPGTVVNSVNATNLVQSFSYEPGFKVGLGMQSPAHWYVHAGYTYYRTTQSTGESAPANPNVASGTGVWLVDDWFLQSTPIADQQVSATHISSTWHMGMDLGDLIFGRPCMGKKGFSGSPFGGLRTVWIRQNMNVAATQASSSVGLSRLVPDQPIHSNTSSHSWGIGPRLGAKGKYLFPMGFSLDGLFGASLLYTKFTSLKHNEQRVSNALQDPVLYANESDYNCVRPVLDAKLGIGWEMDFYESCRFELLASYDFSYFWGQNAMRSMVDEFSHGVSSGDNDLYFQGLTVMAAFRF